MNYRKSTKQYYEMYADEFKEEISKLSKPIQISFEFIRSTRHKFDYINPAQTVQDDMVKHGWIEDDNADILLPVFEKYRYDKKNPGVIIKIFKDE
jgi:Holliday junction resolvase RusA-like endonuclease